MAKKRSSLEIVQEEALKRDLERQAQERKEENDRLSKILEEEVYPFLESDLKNIMDVQVLVGEFGQIIEQSAQQRAFQMTINELKIAEKIKGEGDAQTRLKKMIELLGAESITSVATILNQINNAIRTKLTEEFKTRPISELRLLEKPNAGNNAT
jgi:hypothetical protein